MRTGHSEAGGALEVLDLPGVYDLDVDTPETHIAGAVLAGARGDAPDAVIVIIDACNLSRNLVLVGQLLARGAASAVALNMVDLAARRGLVLDADGVGASGSVSRSWRPWRASGQGLDVLRAALRAPYRAAASRPAGA